VPAVAVSPPHYDCVRGEGKSLRLPTEVDGHFVVVTEKKMLTAQARCLILGGSFSIVFEISRLVALGAGV
jgi:hypothetical protein